MGDQIVEEVGQQWRLDYARREAWAVLRRLSESAAT
jgi:hypothetical protein